MYFYGIPGPKVDYNVIYIDEEAAIEYDCSDSFIFGYNYCVHIISRTPTLSAEKVEELVAFAGKIIFPSKYYLQTFSKDPKGGSVIRSYQSHLHII